MRVSTKQGRLSTLGTFAIFLAMGAGGEARKPDPSFPDSFVLARNSYFDFGPPMNYYDFYSVRPDPAGGSRIEHVELTPAGDTCTQSPTLKIHEQVSGPSVRELLGRINPCAIPEKELTRERKRCKNCLNFSGADLVMQVPCGGQTRRIPVSLLDEDLFSDHPQPPTHASWTMTLLEKLDGPAGAPAMSAPAFPGLRPPVPAELPPNEPSPLAQDLEDGKLDSLLNAPDKPSDLFHGIRNPPPSQEVTLVGITPVDPVSYKLPPYPPLARVAHVGGRVRFSITIQPDGRPSAPRFAEKRIPLLEGAVTAALADWRFPPERAGEDANIEMEFAMNCPAKPAR